LSSTSTASRSAADPRQIAAALACAWLFGGACLSAPIPCRSASDCGDEGSCARGACVFSELSGAPTPAGHGEALRSMIDLPSTPPSLSEYALVQRLIVDPTLFEGEHEGFPLLVARTAPFLRARAHGGEVRSERGEDIVFFDEVGERLLAFDIEEWDPETGALVAWVRLPLLSAGSALWLACGREAPVWSRRAAVWDDGYRAVWHLRELPGLGKIRDATSAGADGEPRLLFDDDRRPAVAGHGLAFERAEAVVDVPIGRGAWAGSTTVEAWARVDPLQSLERAQSLFRAGDELQLGISDFADGLTAFFRVGSAITRCPLVDIAFADDVPIDGWMHYAGVLDVGPGGATRHLYVNGLLCASTTTAAVPSLPAFGQIGNGDEDDADLNGAIDEVRVARSALSAERLRAAAQNGRDPLFLVAEAPLRQGD
jgi:hypothetical protein